MFEVHVLGPALDLPAIDVDCLAVITLLRACFPHNEQAWTLIASNDPGISPFNKLPALRDGDIWVAGFRDIAEYIQFRQHSVSLATDFNFDLDEEQLADSEAYFSFLESRGLPLLDLSLYVSSDNYTTITRSTLSDITPWPQSWTLPLTLRETAKKRSEHLGLSGLDVDAVREQELKKENEGIASAIPKSLRVPKKSVTSLLGSSAESTRFKLEAVTTAFFEPLEALLADNAYLLGDRMSPLDCYALAVFLLMAVDDMPQPWLKHSLQRHTQLWKWTQTHKETIAAVDTLPWQAPSTKSWTQIGRDLLGTIAGSIPVTITDDNFRRLGETQGASSSYQANKFQRQSMLYAQAKHSQQMIRETLASGIALTGLVGMLTYMGVLTFTFPVRQVRSGRHGFGEAGAFLGLR